jgi:hypothetical protein
MFTVQVEISKAYSSSKTFYLALDTQDQDVKENAHEIVASIISSIPADLLSFKETLTSHTCNLSPDTSISSGYCKRNILYLFTKNEGKVLLIRGGIIYTLLSGDSSASGKVQSGDVFIFTTGSTESLKHSKIVNFQQTKKLLDESNISNYVLVSFEEQVIEENDKEYIVSPPKPKTHPFEILKVFKKLNVQSNGKKTITIVIVCILFLLFIWSVVFGVQRRHTQENQKKIETAKQIIEAKLDEASDVSTLNLVRAQSLVVEAKNTLQELKKNVGDSNPKEVDILSHLISQKENSIFKNQDKTSEEFYDLTLINSNAYGQLLSLSGDTLSVVDKTGSIYLLSISKKSQRTITNSSISGIHFIAQWDDSIFLLNDKGIYKSVDSQMKQVVKSDGWGQVSGFAVYNNNLYVLDKANNQIYKYVVAENGYSDKVNYLKDQSSNFVDSNSLVIDSSLYIGKTESVQKFTGGVKDTFNLIIPNIEQLSIDKIYTNPDTKKIYILDKNASSIFIVSKEGSYEKRIDSSSIKEATDFVVAESLQKILLLTKDKIYSISLE